ncbi:MAG: hypothetical protein ACLPWF_04115 [Bryobacteraceae bacterium]
MKSARLTALTLASAAALLCSSAAQADQIEVQFSGVITNAGGAPGISVGETFTGGFSYSAADPLDVSIGGQSTYSLTSPPDNEFVSVGALDLSIQPLTGVHAVVAPGAASFFSIQDFSNPGISITLNGGSSFLSSQALPDPLLTADVTSGSIGFQFSQDSVNYIVDGNITQVSNVPEPRGSVLACLGILALVFLLSRCGAHIFSIFTSARRFATPAV